MPPGADVAALVDGVLAELNEAVRARCNRVTILAKLVDVGCASSATDVRQMLDADEAGLKTELNKVAPPFFFAKFKLAVASGDASADAGPGHASPPPAPPPSLPPSPSPPSSVSSALAAAALAVALAAAALAAAAFAAPLPSAPPSPPPPWAPLAAVVVPSPHLPTHQPRSARVLSLADAHAPMCFIRIYGSTDPPPWFHSCTRVQHARSVLYILNTGARSN